MLKKLLDWDTDTFIYLNSLGAEPYDFFWSILTNIFTWTPLFLLFAILLFINYSKREALFMAFTIIALAIFITIFTEVTKELVGRLRPNNNEEINTFIRILKNPPTLSFFSGHAASSFSITTLVVLFLRKKTYWVLTFYLWPLFFAYSRIYIGVHYPLDILVGALVGSLTAYIFYQSYKRIRAPYLR